MSAQPKHYLLLSIFATEREANRELTVTVEGRTIPSCAEPTYLGVKLGRTLTFRRHLGVIAPKLTLRVRLYEAIGKIKFGSC